MWRALTLRNRIRAWRGDLEVLGPHLPLGDDVDGRLQEGPDPERDLELRQALYREELALALLGMETTPTDWMSWLRQVLEGGGWGPSTGWRIIDEGFLDRVEREANRLEAPEGLFSALAFLKALEERDWPGLRSPSEALVGEITEGRRWINPAVILDAGVEARIILDRPADAEAYFQRLSPFAGRSVRDFRSRLLRAHLDQAVSLR
jgi:hypothetical protein